MLDLVRDELAWAAGFFDGEGCFAVSRRKRIDGTMRCYPLVSIGQTDRFVLDRFQRAVGGIGSVTGPLKASGLGTKPVWQFRVQGFQTTQAIGAMLWDFLSPVKRQRLREVLGK